MRPYLRRLAPEGAPPQPCPRGAVAEPAGSWGGQPMEVVYEPAGHDVVFLRGAVSATVADGLRATGWQHWLSHGDDQMWVRDRARLARRRSLQVRPAAVPHIA
jgi:hypothetical protein